MQNLESFDNSGFDRGRGKWTELSWLLTRSFCFQHSVMPWYRLRRGILRRYGATVGVAAIVKPGVKITFPWKLKIGAHSWVGEDCWLLNLDRIEIGSNVCISQRTLLCTGSHDWSDPGFRLITKPITVEDGVWISANVFVGPGVTIGQNSVVTAGSVVARDLPANMVCSGNPCVPVKPRNWITSPANPKV